MSIGASQLLIGLEQGGVIDLCALAGASTNACTHAHKQPSAVESVRKLHMRGLWHVQMQILSEFTCGRTNAKTRENTNTK